MGMKRIALIMCLAAAPAAAQETEDDPGFLSRGVETFLRELFSDVEPALRELRDKIGELDLDRYHPPEMLPNGDILLRRKQPPEPSEPEETPETAPAEPIEI